MTENKDGSENTKLGLVYLKTIETKSFVKIEQESTDENEKNEFYKCT